MRCIILLLVGLGFGVFAQNTVNQTLNTLGQNVLNSQSSGCTVGSNKTSALQSKDMKLPPSYDDKCPSGKSWAECMIDRFKTK